MMNESRLIKQQIAALWLDRARAKLFLISEDQMQRESFFYIDQKDNNLGSYFERILSKIPPKSLLIILGPDQIKDDFLHTVIEKRPTSAKQIVACETLETDSEIEIANRAYRYINPASKTATKHVKE